MVITAEAALSVYQALVVQSVVGLAKSLVEALSFTVRN